MEHSRTSLSDELTTEIRRRVLDEPGFTRLTLVRHQGGGASRESLRPVIMRGETYWQAERVSDGRTTVRNFTSSEAPTTLTAMLASTGPREYHLMTAEGDLHVRVTRKGRLLVSRGRPAMPAAPAPQPHDRVKDQPLDAFDAGPLLRVLGMSDGDGRPRASAQGKLSQINAFLREVEAALPESDQSGVLEIVDCGSGRAYLTLAACCYLERVRGRRVRVRGIDRNAALVAKANSMAADLDVADRVTFMAADLATCRLDARPDLLLSLHACDTATDQALARGVEWGAGTMLVAPCCQHDLQPQLQNNGPLRALLRHGILRERLADLLTDTFRAQLLRILGYRVRVVEFVSPDATDRNLLLRAVNGARPGQSEAVDEYLELREFWRVAPCLEKLLADRLQPYLRQDTTHE
ncbi:MAG: SAM-dependent methyltransferase [Kiritimatiellae bacterium]|nr:SAM-dependent methyltransferase [Kiritimatiellia bacterium]